MGIITIGIDQNGPFVSSLLHKELTMTPEEKQIMEHFIGLLKNEEPDIVLQVEQRSSNYASLCKDMNDFLRENGQTAPIGSPLLCLLGILRMILCLPHRRIRSRDIGRQSSAASMSCLLLMLLCWRRLNDWSYLCQIFCRTESDRSVH